MNVVFFLTSLQVEVGSCFQLDQFESLLLPENNRPLEPSVLLALKELFNRSNAKTTALHMLSVDCQVAPDGPTWPCRSSESVYIFLF